ncbi:peptidase S8 [Rossellomorea sp. SC111]|uniref:S8 family peptidase n=1 Tax=Rossellomorea sp. SC111 TaxID=2968985 RepID=UPI00215ABD6B|nr:peptidase S8 [Rossellomorea sp. SC111]MCR8850570.1 peptidase S8 [Rossellomorea sp. SC111]
MGKKVFKSLLVIMMMYSLCLSQVPETHAQERSVIEEEPLLLSEVKNKSFNQDEHVHWYTITPSEESIESFTHFRIKLQSEEEVNLTVYSSLENATNDQTFDQYRAYSYSDETASVDFPISWTGPYYLKVESYVEETVEEEIETDQISYTITYDGVSLPPSNGIIGEECPAELSTKERANGKAILQDLRTIRQSLLSNTDNGKELTSLYYKTAPFISSKMIFSKNTRETVYADLVTLKGLLADTAKNGEFSSYTISSSEQKAIQNLYTIAYESAPDSLQKQLENVTNKVDISSLANSSVSQVITKAGLVTTSTSDPSRLIVKIKDGKSQTAALSKMKTYGVQSTKALSQGKDTSENLVVVNLEDQDGKYAASSTKAMQQLAKLPEVEFVEPVQTYQALSADSQYPYQWSLKNNDMISGDIGFEPMKTLLNGKTLEPTIIAVADTGVDHTLADLSDKVLVEKGKNFVDRSDNTMDDNGHGTHVSSIITANSDNYYSIAGINPFVKILPIKVLDSGGSGDTEQIAYGIMYAADQGAKVLNLSLGGPYSRTIEYAMQYASSKGVAIVAASGNDGMEELSYPASSKYAIAVGSTNRLDIVSDFSNYGKGLDLVAPGSDIPALLPDGNVTYMSGTSMATPHVSAVAGLLLSQNPNLKPAEVEKILTETSKDVSFDEQDNPYVYEDEYYEEDPEYPIEEVVPGYDAISGWGRMNAYSAVSAVELSAKVKPILNNQTKVTGSAKTGSTIKIMNGTKQLGISSAKSGTFSITIPVQKADQILDVIISNQDASTSIKKIVEKAPNKPYVNKLTNLSTSVSGSAEPNLKVTVKDSSRKIIASGIVNDEGDFSIKIPKQKEYSTLYVTVLDGYKESSEVKVVVADVIAPTTPKVNAISDLSTSITGSAEASSTVTAKVNGKQIAAVKASSKGLFTLKIKKQKAGSTVVVTAKDAAGNISKGTTLKVIDRTPPAAPKVKAVSDASISISGTTEANAYVVAKVKGKQIATAKASSKGLFTLKIKKQKAGTTVIVTAKDAAGNISKGTNLTVSDKTAPGTPKVNTVTTKSKTVTGKTEPYAVVTIKAKSKTLGTAKANSKGSFTMKIKTQKERTALYVTAKDRAGNVSKMKKVIVK